MLILAAPPFRRSRPIASTVGRATGPPWPEAGATVVSGGGCGADVERPSRTLRAVVQAFSTSHLDKKSPSWSWHPPMNNLVEGLPATGTEN
jgi:hypothetical protein